MTIDRAVFAFAGTIVLVQCPVGLAGQPLVAPADRVRRCQPAAGKRHGHLPGCDVVQGDGRQTRRRLSVEDLIMNKNWIGVTTEMSGAVREIRSGAPDVMKGFSALAQAALRAGALDAKTKELIALAISVATRCDACVGFHAEAAVKQGASRDEVMETMGMAIYMGAGPSVMYAAQAVEAFDQFADQKARSTA